MVGFSFRVREIPGSIPGNPLKKKKKKLINARGGIIFSNPRGVNHRILSDIISDALDHSATLAIYEKDSY